MEITSYYRKCFEACAYIAMPLNMIRTHSEWTGEVG